MRKNTQKVVAENVMKYRKEKGLTQYELGIRCGWASNSIVNYIEKGTRNIRLDKLDKLADALEISVIDLVEDWS